MKTYLVLKKIRETPVESGIQGLRLEDSRELSDGVRASVLTSEFEIEIQERQLRKRGSSFSIYEVDLTPHFALSKRDSTQAPATEASESFDSNRSRYKKDSENQNIRGKKSEIGGENKESDNDEDKNEKEKAWGGGVITRKISFRHSEAKYAQYLHNANLEEEKLEGDNHGEQNERTSMGKPRPRRRSLLSNNKAELKEATEMEETEQDNSEEYDDDSDEDSDEDEEDSYEEEEDKEEREYESGRNKSIIFQDEDEENTGMLSLGLGVEDIHRSCNLELTRKLGGRKQSSSECHDPSWYLHSSLHETGAGSLQRRLHSPPPSPKASASSEDSFPLLPLFESSKSDQGRKSRSRSIRNPNICLPEEGVVNDLQLAVQLHITADREEVRMFKEATLVPAILQFTDNSLEASYMSIMLDSEEDWSHMNHLDGPKASLVMDATLLTTCNLLFYSICLPIDITNCATAIVRMWIFWLSLGVIHFMLVCLLLFPVFVSPTESSPNKNTKEVNAKEFEGRRHQISRFSLLLRQPALRELIISLITILPTMVMLYRGKILSTCLKCSSNYFSDGFLLPFVSLLLHAVPVSSFHWARSITVLIASCMIFFNVEDEIGPRRRYRVDQMAGNNCTKGVISCPVGSQYHISSLICLVLSISLIVSIVRENETISRISFYMAYRAQRRSLAAKNAAIQAEKLLANMLPGYVLDSIRSRLNMNSEGVGPRQAFNYAVTVSNVGVLFACISNFFATCYHDEPEGQGEQSLRRLHRIICEFDNLLDSLTFKDVEKIKTFSDCYVAAAGLNSAEVAQNVHPLVHLLALMRYAFMLRSKIDELNATLSLRVRLEMKLGYNMGSVTAGVIGISRPHYDIWGDTVNVASRMYSTGVPERIQVTQAVYKVLKPYFAFRRLGRIFVKGKGLLTTYACEPLKKRKETMNVRNYPGTGRNLLE